MTIPEVLVAIVLLAVGLLGLGASGLHVSSVLARVERADAVAGFGLHRLELLRAAACRPAPPGDGVAELRRGTAVVASATWTVSPLAGGAVRLRVITRARLPGRLDRGRERVDTLTSAVLCR